MPILDTLIAITFSICPNVEVTFITVHYVYIVACVLLSSAIVYTTGGV